MCYLWYNAIMQNFKNYYFATIRVPQEFNLDFTIWSKIPWGELGITVYIPGENNYCQLNIVTNIGLYGYDRESLIKEVIYKPSRKQAISSPRIMDYYKMDNNFFNKLIDKNSDFDTSYPEYAFLAKASIYESTLNEFIDLVEKEFYIKIKEILNPSFNVYERNTAMESNGCFERNSSFNTTLDNESIDKSIGTFKAAFRKTKRFCDTKSNTKYEREVGTFCLQELNKIVASHELAKLKLTLEEDLCKSEKSQMKVKI